MDEHHAAPPALWLRVAGMLAAATVPLVFFVEAVLRLWPAHPRLGLVGAVLAAIVVTTAMIRPWRNTP